MYVNDIISKLNQHRIRFGNIDYFIASKVENEINKLANECVRWSIEDFENIAKQKKGDDWEEWYDKNFFADALFNMIQKYSADIGINWDTVEYYLNLYCRKKYPPIK